MRIANKALSISPRAESWLKITQRPRILNVFPPVVNLVNQVSDVLSIVVPEIGNGPFSIVVEGGNFDQIIDRESKVELNEKGISIGGLFIAVDQPKAWEPVPDWERIRNLEVSQYVPIIQSILKNEAAEDSIAQILFVEGNSSENKFAKATRAGVTDLTVGFSERDLNQIQTGAKHLAGLGIGLTPAGDDFLVGFMQGLWGSREVDWAKTVCKAIINSAVPKTNSLSAAWLRAAASGEVGEVWHDLFGAMLAGDQNRVENSVRRILPTGHTSGADALAGFAHVLDLEGQS